MPKKILIEHRCKICGTLGRPYVNSDYKYSYGDRPKKQQYHLKAGVIYDKYGYPQGYYLCEEHSEEKMELVNGKIIKG